MSERNFDPLERELFSLGQSLRWTPTPDLAAAVQESAIVPLPPRSDHSWRRWALAAAFLLLLIGGVLAASSSARDSVAGLLGIDGLRIELGEPDTTPKPNPVLGTPTTFEDFERWLSFTPLQPSALGTPDVVYLRVLETGQAVGISAWSPSDTLPETPETGQGAVLMQFTAIPDGIYLLKSLDLRDATITETTIAGNPGWWVEGTSSISISGANGPDSRPSANVLIWQQDGIGFRFETALPMDDAIAIAETMEPAP
jgi:hypothetical protein